MIRENTMLHIDKDILRFWTLVGHRIGVLEFVWGSQFSGVKEQFASMLKEIVSYLPKDLVPDQSSFQSFTNSILHYYLRNNYMIYASILLGIAILRTTLIGESSDPTSNLDMKRIALSALDGISDELIDDKEALFKFIYSNKRQFAENINKGIELLVKLTYTTFETTPQNVSDASVQSEYVFISYSSSEYSEASNVCSVLEKKGIRCWMAPDSIPSGADYGELIPKAIAGCKVFLLLLSEKSQLSKWVPKELDCAITNERIIIPFHLDNSQLKQAFDFRLSNVQRIEAYKRIDKAYTILLDRILAIIHNPKKRKNGK